jgi:hypothetical protein
MHLYSLRKTISPYLKKNVAINGVNTTQLIFEEVQTFTCWLVEDLNLPSINYLHASIGELRKLRPWRVPLCFPTL